VKYLSSVLGIILALPASAGAEGYLQVRLEGTVDLGMAPLVERALATAKEQAATGVLLEVDTFGGRLDAAVTIRDLILESDIPVTCWVNKRAISAGALICLAADTIDMAPGSTLGAATPVKVGDTDGETGPVDSKTTSYVRKEFAATAEATKRRTDVAEAMVDRDVEVKDFAGPRPLTLTTDDALKLGIAVRSSTTSGQAATESGLTGVALVVEMNWAEKVARAISNSIVSGLLLSIGLLGLYVEIKTPGWGPGIVGLAALGTFFFGHHVVNLAGWEELLLVLMGIVLLIIEIFVLPGFGIAGVSGLIFLGTGLLLAMIGHDFGLATAAGTVRAAAVTLSSAILVSAAAFVGVLRLLPHSRFARAGLYLDDSIQAPTGSFANDLSVHVGRSGIARTMLRPSGVVVVDGERLDAVSEGEVIPAATRVLVVGVRGSSVVVRIAPEVVA
jgi:membrane-bound serine protease (ClpP class)